MRIGLSCDLKEKAGSITGVPDDAFEEYDSPETVETIVRALEAAGHSVAIMGGGRDFLANVCTVPVDIVFNISEGRGTYRSREAQVPSVLEMLDIPYTGSDPQCLSVCLDKTVTKKLVRSLGVATPGWVTVLDDAGVEAIDGRLGFPVIVKPAFEGSSKGIRYTSLARDVSEARAEASRILRAYRQPVMVEEFVDGEEVTVGIVGNSPPAVVGVMRIVPRKKDVPFVYSVEVKRDYVNLVDYECPARLDTGVLDRLEADSLAVFNGLECRDFARVDFRVDREGRPLFLEVNPLPGLGSYSDLVIMACKMGWTHNGLIQAVFESAVERYRACAAG